MSKLPIVEEMLTPFAALIEKLRLCRKVMISKKVIVTTISTRPKTFKTESLSVTTDELAITSRLTMLNVTQDQDLKSKVYENLNAVL